MISIEDLSYTYSGLPAVKGLTLSVPAGRIYALLGKNGAGKTTTLHLLLGFLKPQRGRILIAGDPAASKPGQGRPSLGFVPENLALYPTLSGLENVQYLAPGNPGRRDCEEVLSQVGISRDIARRRAGTYSKGMRQRVGLAIALAGRASILVLDEPTSGLDPSGSVELAEVVRSVVDSTRAALITTHDLFFAARGADHGGILVAGSLIREFPFSGISPAELESTYLASLGTKATG
jgi:ABC-2 type transport system ATP-binding protein